MQQRLAGGALAQHAVAAGAAVEVDLPAGIEFGLAHRRGVGIVDDWYISSLPAPEPAPARY
jgi:hypothetical protein